ncbi:hypothetical protein [Pseudonocardia thermophila]|jgi:hypothetical protein|uniref:hypothetical protein n=1 Tax=Pseudonocardia thermophila TaxID=1848 RepID=UPI00248D3DF4|nr:hypothetical protein [Pseudonocardia thermophila]
MSMSSELPVDAPEGQQASVRALSVTLTRASIASGLATGVVIAIVFWITSGLPGLVGALCAVVIGVGGSLITTAAMWITAAGEPRSVMLASFASSITKMAAMLIALFALAGTLWVDRTSLAVGTIVVLIVTTTAEGWAAHRFRSYAVAPAEPASTSTSTTGSGSSSFGRPGDAPVTGDSGGGPGHDPR